WLLCYRHSYKALVVKLPAISLRKLRTFPPKALPVATAKVASMPDHLLVWIAVTPQAAVEWCAQQICEARRSASHWFGSSSQGAVNPRSNARVPLESQTENIWASESQRGSNALNAIAR